MSLRRSENELLRKKENLLLWDFVSNTEVSVHEDIELFAKQEGLTAHANSINVRFR